MGALFLLSLSRLGTAFCPEKCKKEGLTPFPELSDVFLQ